MAWVVQSVDTLPDTAWGRIVRAGRALTVDTDGVPIGKTIPGRGAGAMPLLSRATDPAHGQAVYAGVCATCHGADGKGQREGSRATIPPLWGEDSFNDGAGMDRLISAANFIRSNMPYGTTWEKPALTP